MKDKFDETWAKMNEDTLYEASSDNKKQYLSWVKTRDKKKYQSLLEWWTGVIADIEQEDQGGVWQLLWNGVKPFKKIKPNDLWKEMEGTIEGMVTSEGTSIEAVLDRLAAL